MMYCCSIVVLWTFSAVPRPRSGCGCSGPERTSSSTFIKSSRVGRSRRTLSSTRNGGFPKDRLWNQWCFCFRGPLRNLPVILRFICLAALSGRRCKGLPVKNFVWNWHYCLCLRARFCSTCRDPRCGLSGSSLWDRPSLVAFRGTHFLLLIGSIWRSLCFGAFFQLLEMVFLGWDYVLLEWSQVPLCYVFRNRTSVSFSISTPIIYQLLSSITYPLGTHLTTRIVHP